LQISGCRFQVADFRLQISGCRFQVAEFIAKNWKKLENKI
jgi:hypothetical protein